MEFVCGARMSIEQTLKELLNKDARDLPESRHLRTHCPALFCDELLQMLAREYMQARHNYKTLCAEHGEDAPMAQMAAEMLETVGASVETRLWELGLKIEDLKALIKHHNAKSPRTPGYALSDKGALKQRRDHELKRQKEIREKKSAEAFNILWAFLLYMMMTSPYQRTGPYIPFLDAGEPFRRAAGGTES